jgi:hypothetical protein
LPDLGERQATAVAANVLERSFDAFAPNRKWIADFTYVWTAEGWLYVAAVIDLFSRRVVGWSMSAATAQLVTDALVMAIWRQWIDMPILLGSNRLSIIDLSADANQPMEFDDLMIGYNGEVYNYLEIKDELIRKGYRFRTSSTQKLSWQLTKNGAVAEKR